VGNSEAGQQSRVISKGSRYDLVLGGHGGGINFGGLVMRFLMTVNGGGRAPDEQMYANIGRFVEELTRVGVLLATGGRTAARTSPPPARTSR
jgi:predicted alternative tryptophan synthase beta-subunit